MNILIVIILYIYIYIYIYTLISPRPGPHRGSLDREALARPGDVLYVTVC